MSYTIYDIDRIFGVTAAGVLVRIIDIYAVFVFVCGCLVFWAGREYLILASMLGLWFRFISFLT